MDFEEAAATWRFTDRTMDAPACRDNELGRNAVDDGTESSRCGLRLIHLPRVLKVECCILDPFMMYR